MPAYPSVMNKITILALSVAASLLSQARYAEG